MLTDRALDSHSGRLVLLDFERCPEEDPVQLAFAGIEYRLNASIGICGVTFGLTDGCRGFLAVRMAEGSMADERDSVRKR
jgi:hypothetical protein